MSTVALGDIANWGSGGTPLRSVREYFGEGLPWLSIADLNDGLVDDAKESLTPLGIEHSSAKPVPPGTLLVAMYGSIGKLGIAARELCTSQAIAFAIPDARRVDTRYLFHFLLSERPRLQSRGRGGTQSNIGQGDLKAWQMPLPPLPEQRRIAAILDKADALRGKRRAAIQKLDELSRSIFLDMFGDPVTNPKSWPMHKLGSLLAFQQYGPRFYNEAYSEDGVRIVRITDLDEAGALRFTDMPRMLVSVEDEAKYRLRAGDVIFARTGATVGKVALIGPGDPPCIAGAYFIVMRFDPKQVDPGYALAVLMAPSIRAIVASRSRQAAQQNFSGPGLRALPMPLPPIELQREFVQHVVTVESLKISHRAALVKLDTFFGSLQHHAFRGEM